MDLSAHDLLELYLPPVPKILQKSADASLAAKGTTARDSCGGCGPFVFSASQRGALGGSRSAARSAVFRYRRSSAMSCVRRRCERHYPLVPECTQPWSSFSDLRARHRRISCPWVPREEDHEPSDLLAPTSQLDETAPIPPSTALKYSWYFIDLSACLGIRFLRLGQRRRACIGSFEENSSAP